VRFTSSLDGGETFLPSVKVSEAPHSVGPATVLSVASASLAAKNSGGEGIGLYLYSTEWPGGGHTAGMAADAGGAFHPLWVDNRTGVHQVWTSAITVEGRATLHGSPDLAELADLSDSTFLEITDTVYDPTNGQFVLKARVENRSSRPIRGPLKVRVTSLAVTDAGAARIGNADNGLTGPGAVWDFAAPGPSGVLPPGASSAPRSLIITLEHPTLLKEDGTPVGGLAHLQARV
jgi:hypothetical protein